MGDRALSLMLINKGSTCHKEVLIFFRCRHGRLFFLFSTCASNGESSHGLTAIPLIGDAQETMVTLRLWAMRFKYRMSWGNGHATFPTLVQRYATWATLCKLVLTDSGQPFSFHFSHFFHIFSLCFDKKGQCSASTTLLVKQLPTYPLLDQVMTRREQQLLPASLYSYKFQRTSVLSPVLHLDV